MRNGSAADIGHRTSDLGLQTSDAYGRGSRAEVRLRFLALLCVAAILSFLSCSAKPDPNTLVMIIESSPTNLDPRVGIDAFSERIDSLIFDDLLSRGDDLNVAPGLAERWDVPDPLTYIFHLHHGVKFHDGRALTSRDVKWTLDSLLQGKILSTKKAAYHFVDHIDAPDDFTVIFHLKEADAALLWNLSDGAMGIVPYGSGDEMTFHPIGSGPFKCRAQRRILGREGKAGAGAVCRGTGRNHGGSRIAQRQCRRGD
jgi:peptide/nickel transport system substrate-binding protein